MISDMNLNIFSKMEPKFQNTPKKKDIFLNVDKFAKNKKLNVGVADIRLSANSALRWARATPVTSFSWTNFAEICMQQYFWVMNHMVCLSTNLRCRCCRLFVDIRNVEISNPRCFFSSRRSSMKMGMQRYFGVTLIWFGFWELFMMNSTHFRKINPKFAKL